MGSHPSTKSARRAAALGFALWTSVAALAGQAATPALAPDEVRAAAVRRGVEFLLASQQRDGSWDYESRRHPSGQTALCAYALLKSGLPAQHAAIRRARAFVEAELPATTYTLGCELLLCTALREPALEPRMRALVARLLECGLAGEWGYPLTHADPVWIDRAGRPDLSNTQYAVLGLRAAVHAGVEVPRKLWGEVFERTFDYQEPPRAVDGEALLGRKSPGRVDAAGFRYVSDGSAAATGSMTAAGLTVLGCAREMLGDSFGARRQRELDAAFELGTRWLAANWSVSANPGGGEWHKYYLYGLERVGSLFATEEFLGRRWFDEGAAELLATQAANGSWGDSNPDTCFAILFLQRATSTSSGEKAEPARDTFASAEAGELQVLGVGQPAITLWLRAPDAALRARFPEGLFVERVDYLIDGEVAVQVEADGSQAWENQGFPARHEFTRRGLRRVEARVQLAGDPAPAPLVSGAFEVDVRYPLEPWMLDFAGARTRDLLRGASVSASASSKVSEGEGAAAACDGLQGTRWLAAEGDALPWLKLELARKLKVGAIVLSQATAREQYRGHMGRFVRAELLLDGARKPIEVVFDSDEMRPTRVVLDPPRSLERLELRLVERSGAISWPQWVGLAEIALEAP
jgi:hypothetical protein